MNALDTYSHPPLETLDDFKRRIGYQYEPLGNLTVPASQSEKVDVHGNLKPYLGDTVIFELNTRTLTALRFMQRELYSGTLDLLCNELPVESFHLTLHDLLSAPYTDAESRHYVYDALHTHSADVEALLKQFRSAYSKPIRLVTTNLFNMVGKSIVLGLAPADEESCSALMFMYRALQAIVPLPYPLTPHITLAYYKPPRLDAHGNPFPHEDEAVDRLRNAMQRAFKHFDPKHVRLDINNLHHRCFFDMTRYISPSQFMLEYVNKVKAEEFVHYQPYYKAFEAQMALAGEDLKNARAQMTHDGIEPNADKCYYDVLYKYLANGLCLTPKDIDSRFQKACSCFFQNTTKAFYHHKSTRTISDQPESQSDYQSQMQRDIMAAAILLNMRERNMLTKEDTGLDDVDLIYTCLYELQW